VRIFGAENFKNFLSYHQASWTYKCAEVGLGQSLFANTNKDEM